jgi:hypothetical protein
MNQAPNLNIIVPNTIKVNKVKRLFNNIEFHKKFI